MSDDFGCLGIDIGGANLKYASSRGQAMAIEFPLWNRPNDLADQIAADLLKFPDTSHVHATMTGELADCFLNREIGVRHITDQLGQATARRGLPAPRYYCVDGHLHSPESAVKNVDGVAAANWHALAEYVARQYRTLFPDGGLLVDIGSTTTDLIPFRDGTVVTDSRTDFDRLSEGSLVYVGGGRTPVCSIVDRLPRDGKMIPVMREVFATMDDARLLLGYRSPDRSDLASADGKPRDEFHAANRMARMIGLDHRSVTIDVATDLAKHVHSSARNLIDRAVTKLETDGLVESRCPLVISGHADDLLTETLCGRAIVSLRQILGDKLSRCAPAFALASLSA